MTWELKFMEWGNDGGGHPVLDRWVPYVTYLGSHLCLGRFYYIDLDFDEAKKGFLSISFSSMPYNPRITYSIKFLIRPEEAIGISRDGHQLPKGQGEILDPSFPSAHAFCVFMMATLLATGFPRYRIYFFHRCRSSSDGPEST